MKNQRPVGFVITGGDYIMETGMAELIPTKDHIRVLNLFIEGKAKCINDVILQTDYSPEMAHSLVKDLERDGALLISVTASTECKGVA